MDLARVAMLLRALHDALHVPATENIRAEIMKEIYNINKSLALPVESLSPQERGPMLPAELFDEDKQTGPQDPKGAANDDKTAFRRI